MSSGRTETAVARADAWLSIHAPDGMAVPAPWRWPKAMRGIVEHARGLGWRLGVSHAVDSGGSPYYSVEFRRGDAWVRLCWHTRDHGPTQYRLFSSLAFDPDRRGYDQYMSLRRLREWLAED